MDRGTAIHDSIEKFFVGSSTILHPDIHRNYGQFLTSIKETYDTIHPEYKWGVTWEFEPCDYDDPKAMIHGFVDLLVLPDEPNLLQYEWKTGGKYTDQHDDQACKYAISMMCHFPKYEGVDSYITYLDHQDFRRTHYPASMMFEYKPMLRREIGQIADSTRFPPKPSFKCRWCKFSSKNNGGPCRVG
jgi:hypothetical protein